MYSPEKVQQAAEKIIAALGKRQLKENSIRQYRLHYQALNTYIKNNGFESIDEDTLLEFLRFQYDVHISNLHARGFDYIAGGHIRPFAVLNWYLVTGEIDSRARVRTPPFICPEGFCDSYDAFMNYLDKMVRSWNQILCEHTFLICSEICWYITTHAGGEDKKDRQITEAPGNAKM